VALDLVMVGLKMPDASMREIHMNFRRIKGIVDVPSNHSVDDTVGKLKTILQAKGITLFALNRSQRRSGESLE